MSRIRFERLPGSLLDEPKNQRLFELTAKGISVQIEFPAFVLDVARLASIPLAAQTIYWLWRFQCEAGICGMDVLVLNSLGKNTPQIHAALVEVKANELGRLLEAAISLARCGPAEFKKLSDQTWFDGFPLSTQFEELHLINRPAFAATKALGDLAATFIRTHKDALFGE